MYHFHVSFFFFFTVPNPMCRFRDRAQGKAGSLSCLSSPVGFSRMYMGVVSFVSILLGLADLPTSVSHAFSWI